MWVSVPERVVPSVENAVAWKTYPVGRGTVRAASAETATSRVTARYEEKVFMLLVAL
jgi:hypothetical protein